MFKSIGELNLNLQINSIIVISNQKLDLFKFDFKETAKESGYKHTCKGPEALDNCKLFGKSYCS